MKKKIIKFNTLLINTEIRILKYFIENRIMKFKDFTDFKKLLSNMIRINIKYTDFDIKVKTIEWLMGINGIKIDEGDNRL